ncbi:MAG: aldehyde dehydrogenase family protein, partial [Gammaproteobacteria bacterium]|nr:aldehyde dehydrogenase family protein [Gammaproteobacteria bacterium]
MDALARHIPILPEAAAPTRIAHYINGARVEGADAPTSPVYNPATGAQTGILPLADRAQVDVAVAAAKAAFPAWA